MPSYGVKKHKGAFQIINHSYNQGRAMIKGLYTFQQQELRGYYYFYRVISENIMDPNQTLVFKT